MIPPRCLPMGLGGMCICLTGALCFLQKKRGRRAGTKDDELESGPAKKAKKDGEENAYMKEVAKFKERSLREEGSGVRPLVK